MKMNDNNNASKKPFAATCCSLLETVLRSSVSLTSVSPVSLALQLCLKLGFDRGSVFSAAAQHVLASSLDENKNHDPHRQQQLKSSSASLGSILVVMSKIDELTKLVEEGTTSSAISCSSSSSSQLINDIFTCLAQIDVDENNNNNNDNG